MSTRLGMDAKLYRNSGSFGSPIWTEVTNVKDLTLNLEKGEADVTTRANGGWRATVGTLGSRHPDPTADRASSYEVAHAG